MDGSRRLDDVLDLMQDTAESLLLYDVQTLTAEAAMLQGDKELALQKAKLAQGRFKTGTPEWTRANDILNFAGRD